jgi:hypothetical protein
VDNPYPVVGSNGITGYHNEYLVEGPAIIVGRKWSAGEVTLIEKNCFPIDTTYFIKQSNPTESTINYIYWLLKALNLPELRGGAGIPGLNRTDVYERFKLPLPPLEVQKDIVVEVVGEAGLEPATPGLEGRCSVQLSYSPTHSHCSREAAVSAASAFQRLFVLVHSMRRPTRRLKGKLG